MGATLPHPRPILGAEWPDESSHSQRSRHERQHRDDEEAVVVVSYSPPSLPLPPSPPPSPSPSPSPTPSPAGDAPAPRRRRACISRGASDCPAGTPTANVVTGGNLNMSGSPSPEPPLPPSPPPPPPRSRRGADQRRHTVPLPPRTPEVTAEAGETEPWDGASKETEVVLPCSTTHTRPPPGLAPPPGFSPSGEVGAGRGSGRASSGGGTRAADGGGDGCAPNPQQQRRLTLPTTGDAEVGSHIRLTLSSGGGAGTGSSLSGRRPKPYSCLPADELMEEMRRVHQYVDKVLPLWSAMTAHFEDGGENHSSSSSSANQPPSATAALCNRGQRRTPTTGVPGQGVPLNSQQNSVAAHPNWLCDELQRLFQADLRRNARCHPTHPPPAQPPPPQQPPPPPPQPLQPPPTALQGGGGERLPALQLLQQMAGAAPLFIAFPAPTAHAQTPHAQQMQSHARQQTQQQPPPPPPPHGPGAGSGQTHQGARAASLAASLAAPANPSAPATPVTPNSNAAGQQPSHIQVCGASAGTASAGAAPTGAAHGAPRSLPNNVWQRQIRKEFHDALRLASAATGGAGGAAAATTAAIFISAAAAAAAAAGGACAVAPRVELPVHSYVYRNPYSLQQSQVSVVSQTAVAQGAGVPKSYALAAQRPAPASAPRAAPPQQLAAPPPQPQFQVAPLQLVQRRDACASVLQMQPQQAQLLQMAQQLQRAQQAQQLQHAQMLHLSQQLQRAQQAQQQQQQSGAPSSQPVAVSLVMPAAPSPASNSAAPAPAATAGDAASATDSQGYSLWQNM